MPEPAKDDKSSQQLIELYDQFCDFASHCSFLCDSFSSLTLSEELNEHLSEETVNGIHLSSDRLKHQLRDIKGKLKILCYRQME